MPSVPLSEIAPSPLNPRKTFDEATLRELGASIQSKGLLQPIVVRPYSANGRKSRKKNPPKYEIVAGERRFRAMHFTNRTDIECNIVSLSDREVIEVAVVENEQRDDVSLLEKAAGYASLIKDHGVSIEDLAGRIGKSQSTVREMLSVHEHLPPESRQAMEAGALSYSVAVLISKLPKSQRAKVEEYALADHYNEGPASYRMVKEFIQDECVIELKKAPFDRKALDLVPGVPSCDDCPKRAGNLAQIDEEYAGVRADMCTDPACYREKSLAAASNAGSKVLSDKDSKSLFSFGRLRSSKYRDFQETCYDDRKYRSFGELLGKHLNPKDIVVATDDRGEMHRLIPMDVANKVIKEQKLIVRETGRYQSNQSAADRKKAIEDGKIDKLLREAILDKACLQSLMLFDSVTLNHKGKAAIQELLLDLMGSLWFSVVEILGRHQFPDIKKPTVTKYRQAFNEYILSSDRSCANLWELLCAGLAAKHCLNHYGYGDRDKTVAELFEIDRKKMHNEARVQVKADAATKTKKP